MSVPTTTSRVRGPNTNLTRDAWTAKKTGRTEASRKPGTWEERESPPRETWARAVAALSPSQTAGMREEGPGPNVGRAWAFLGAEDWGKSLNCGVEEVEVLGREREKKEKEVGEIPTQALA